MAKVEQVKDDRAGSWEAVLSLCPTKEPSAQQAERGRTVASPGEESGLGLWCRGSASLLLMESSSCLDSACSRRAGFKELLQRELVTPSEGTSFYSTNHKSIHPTFPLPPRDLLILVTSHGRGCLLWSLALHSPSLVL